jgi:cell division transport system ATP-binding protein
MGLFRRFNEVGVTVIVATHDLHLVRESGLREIVLDDGRIGGGDDRGGGPGPPALPPMHAER